MSDSEPDADIDAIRAKKREELAARAGTGDESADGETAGSQQTDPVHVDGADALSGLTSRDDLVLVDFYAEWCGPCKMMEPTLATLARDSPVTVAKVDVDRNQALAQDLGIRGVPTLFLFVEGEPVKRLVGMQSETALRDVIDQFAD